MEELYVVTMIGVGISTYVELFATREGAENGVATLFGAYLVENAEPLCKDTWKGYSAAAQCDIEIQIHEKKVFN